jgi:hypothetical protein
MQFLKLTAFLALALSASASVLSLASRQEDTCGNPEDPCGEPSLPDCCTGLQCVANDVGDMEVCIDLSVIVVMKLILGYGSAVNFSETVRVGGSVYD